MFKEEKTNDEKPANPWGCTHTCSLLKNKKIAKIYFGGEFLLTQNLIEGHNRLGLALCYIVM